MKTTKKLLALLLLLILIVPAKAATGTYRASDGEAPLPQAPAFTNEIRTQAQPQPIKHPTKSEIVAKRQSITSSQTIFATDPSVVAPYATGSLTEEFMATGLTYLNYIRFVAGLPEVTLDDTLNLDAQHGAVLLAAIDELTHYPHQPADMDDAFYNRGYSATTSSNISYRWGYDPLENIKNSIQGCMNDNSSLNNLSTVGHRRWLLNPPLGKVGFGYAQSATGASYIVTKVFDFSGVGCTYDFISWPVAGNHPTELFHPANPWSVTLNNSVFQTASANSVKITVTRESDGTQWTFDGTTGQPNTAIAPYLVVNNQGYGQSNCIIFHPGTSNVDTYEGVYRVKISGIFYRDGSAAELNYTVDFFDVTSACPEHNYAPEVTPPTCNEQGYTSYVCTLCGNSYITEYVDALGHDWGEWYTYKEPTCNKYGEERSDCQRCPSYQWYYSSPSGHNYVPTVIPPTCTEQGYTTYTCPCGNSYIDDYVDSLGHDMGQWFTTIEPSCINDGEQRSDCSRCDHYETKVITSSGHNHIPNVTSPTCTEQGYTTYTCPCGDSYIDNYVDALDHDHQYTSTTNPTCTKDGFELYTCSRCGTTKTVPLTASGHHYGDDTVCDNCGFDSTSPEYPENALMLSGEEFADQDTVWIEGLPYPVEDNGVSRYVELPTEDDCYMVTYTYHTGDASDIHTQYPTGMKVYKVSEGEITHIPQLDNLLQYSGASIRITGKKGIRMITSLNKETKNALTGKGLAGFKLLEYGTALCFASEIQDGDALVLGRDFTRSNYAYKKGVADPVFASTKDLIQYTNVLVGFSLDQCKDDIAMRPYIILEDAAGNQITLYGGTIYRSIGYIAYQNRTVFTPKTASYNYVWEIIHHVYGDKYDADYKG